ARRFAEQAMAQAGGALAQELQLLMDRLPRPARHLGDLVLRQLVDVVQDRHLLHALLEARQEAQHHLAILRRAARRPRRALDAIVAQLALAAPPPQLIEAAAIGHAVQPAELALRRAKALAVAPQLEEHLLRRVLGHLIVAHDPAAAPE